MAGSLKDRLEHAWNAFQGRRDTDRDQVGGQSSYGSRPDRTHRPRYNYARVITPILNQIAIDAAGVELRHVRVGPDREYLEDIISGMNHCFNTWPNLDQGPTQFRQDIVMTMLEEGVVAVVPTWTSQDPDSSGGYDIFGFRVGIIKDWWAKKVLVDLYNEDTGEHEELVLDKDDIAIVENPLYAIMNEPNSTLQRLIYKLGQLDVTDDRLAAGKLDIILQLPYTIKHEAKLAEAKKRVTDIEGQLTGSKHGIGYIDSTERITQLNRPSENNLLEQVKNLEQRVYTQMGLTEAIFFGTADEAAMLNYQNRTVFPIVKAIQEEFRRKFLTKTALTRGQSIQYFRSPFNLVPVSQIAEIADKFTRNEIMAPNEFRPIVGLRPVKDPKANELRNRNMPEVEPTPDDTVEPTPDDTNVEEPPQEQSKAQKLLRTISRREQNK